METEGECNVSEAFIKANYSKPAQPQVMTSVDLAADLLVGGTGADGPSTYGSLK